MVLEIEEVLDAGTAAAMAERLAQAPWADGKVTAGYQSAIAKHNEQLPEDSPLASELGEMVLAALGRSLLFQSAALPAAIFPPLFNRYAGGGRFDTHIDNAIRVTRDGRRLRTDLSCTLFLTPPDSYRGGELIIEDGSQARAFKLSAGSALLYPATTLHRVEPVTHGARLASFFWVQSLVPDAAARAVLFDIDLAIQSFRRRVGDDDHALIALTGAYHNLLRRFCIC